METSIIDNSESILKSLIDQLQPLDRSVDINNILLGTDTTGKSLIDIINDFFRRLNNTDKQFFLEQIQELTNIDRQINEITYDDRMFINLKRELLILQYNTIIAFLKKRMPEPPHQLIELLQQKIKTINKLLEDNQYGLTNMTRSSSRSTLLRPAEPEDAGAPGSAAVPAGGTEESKEEGGKKYSYYEKYMKYKNKYLELKNK